MRRRVLASARVLPPFSPGLSGWYLRVLAPGPIAAGEACALVERPNPRWPVARLNRLIAARSTPAADVALGWLLHQPAVTAPVTGRAPWSSWTASLRALEVTLSDETLRRLDAIWPGPGGEAPSWSRRITTLTRDASSKFFYFQGICLLVNRK